MQSMAPTLDSSGPTAVKRQHADTRGVTLRVRPGVSGRSCEFRGWLLQCDDSATDSPAAVSGGVGDEVVFAGVDN